MGTLLGKCGAPPPGSRVAGALRFMEEERGEGVAEVRRKPLKRLDSEKEMKGNERKNRGFSGVFRRPGRAAKGFANARTELRRERAAERLL
jgi:hypothetical protein